MIAKAKLLGEKIRNEDGVQEAIDQIHSRVDGLRADIEAKRLKRETLAEQRETPDSSLPTMSNALTRVGRSGFESNVNTEKQIIVEIHPADDDADGWCYVDKTDEIVKPTSRFLNEEAASADEEETGGSGTSPLKAVLSMTQAKAESPSSRFRPPSLPKKASRSNLIPNAWKSAKPPVPDAPVSLSASKDSTSSPSVYSADAPTNDNGPTEAGLSAETRGTLVSDGVESPKSRKLLKVLRTFTKGSQSQEPSS
jgi:hypothetical protein